MSAVTSIAERAKQRPEIWYPTSALRFRREWVSDTKAVRILQQKHISNHGNEEWRDVPLDETV